MVVMCLYKTVLYLGSMKALEFAGESKDISLWAVSLVRIEHYDRNLISLYCWFTIVFIIRFELYLYVAHMLLLNISLF